MSTGTAGILESIRSLAESLPSGVVDLATTAIAGCPAGDWPLVRHRAQAAIGHPASRALMGNLIDRWQVEAPGLPPVSVALALEAASATADHLRREQRIELVWTGPESELPLRRTEQALQQVIAEARRDLLVVSYTVYDIPAIGQALAAAAEHAVRLRLVIESPEAEGGHIAYNALAAFGARVQARAEVYRWPPEQRPRHGDKIAALHAKCAVADERLMLVSSANLTRYALDFNMELGMLIRGGAQPRQVARHFGRLIDAGVLVRAN